MTQRSAVEMLARSALAAALIATVVVLSAYPFDDAFIHLRLARAWPSTEVLQPGITS
jgi:hypothetical protein